MKKVLVIEDEPGFREMLKKAFENANFEVILASDGKQGIIEAIKQRPDFILTDLIMSGMDGTSFIRHIMDIEDLNQIPIAVVTVVPDGVPQNLEGGNLFKNIVGFWVKDQLTTKEIVQKVKDYLK
ncbi:MAG TPA: response regulator [Patescibacteria group bacterium]|nr:response regulator [Patescibacteria group bacterium]